MKTSLSVKIKFLILALCLGFGVAVLTVFGVVAKRQAHQSIIKDASATSTILASTLQERGRLLAALTRSMAAEPHVTDLTMTDRATVADAIGSLRQQSGVDAMIIADKAGLPLGQSGFKSNVNDGKIRTVASHTLSQGSWQGVVIRDGELYIAAAEPLAIGTLNQGVLINYLRLDGALAQSITQSGSLQIGFVSQGKVVSGSGPLLGQTINPQIGTWETTLKGVSYSAHYQKLVCLNSDLAVGIVVTRPTAEIMGAFHQFEWTFAALLAVLTLLTFAAGSAFGTRFVRSLAELVHAAEEIKRGIWPSQVEVRSTDEVGLLQESFNQMVSAAQQSEARLLAMIDLDPLTGLDNHRRFKERLQYEATRSSSNQEKLTLLLLDIDGFSAYNEAQGHGAGDQVLQAIAKAVRTYAPELAMLARYGGEEFAILIPNCTETEVLALFASIQEGISEVTLSGGYAESSSAKDRTEGLLIGAELALAAAKHNGKGLIHRFESDSGDGEAELYRALQDASFAAVKALAAAVDAKDPYTHGHSERVAHYASDLARFVGCEESEVDLVLRSGSLHDVGKIGVPDAVLQKPGRLDEDEQRQMQAHPVLGEIIVAKVPQLVDLLPGIRHHHERFDGKGYPDGLIGNSIPKSARLLAVADTFDAMTSDRPYRKGMAWEIALTEIGKGAGTQFDPEFAAAFVRLMTAKIPKAA